MMKRKHELTNKWIGLIEVQKIEGVDVLGDNRGAHVTTLAWCKNRDQYNLVVQEALRQEGLELVLSEEVETCQERIANYEIDDEVRNAMAQLSENNPVVFMMFHTFPLDDDSA